MGARLFLAIYPPVHVRENLADFLEARSEMRWSDPAQWHITLAFMESVPLSRIEALEDALAENLQPLSPFSIALRGGGAFPNPDRPAVLWVGIDDGDARLAPLARRVRGVANGAGARPDGRAFVPHLTVARPPRDQNATKWIRVLETYNSEPWDVHDVHLVESQFVGKGHRARHQTLAVFSLNGDPAADTATTRANHLAPNSDVPRTHGASENHAERGQL